MYRGRSRTGKSVRTVTLPPSTKKSDRLSLWIYS